MKPGYFFNNEQDGATSYAPDSSYQNLSFDTNGIDGANALNATRMAGSKNRSRSRSRHGVIGANVLTEEDQRWQQQMDLKFSEIEKEDLDQLLKR